MYKNNKQKIPKKNAKADKKVTLKTDSQQNSFGKSPLSPFLAKTLEGRDFVFASYCQRHNMIVACFLNSTITLYDAKTLMPFKGRKTLRLKGYVQSMSYDDETDTFILGCDSGCIYTYNAGSDELNLWRKCEKSVQNLAFANSRFYTFGYYRSGGLAIGSLNNENVPKTSVGKSDCTTVKCLPKRNLLISSFENGFIRIYRLPHLQTFCSVAVGEMVAATEIINMKGKEYIVTSGRDFTVKIWHLVKGRMRLLRVIQIEKVVNSMVYLKNYKMIAAVYDRTNEIRFWNIFSGKLEKTFIYGKSIIFSKLFLMKDKNIIGGIVGRYNSGFKYDSIEFIQLHSGEDK